MEELLNKKMTLEELEIKMFQAGYNAVIGINLNNYKNVYLNKSIIYESNVHHAVLIRFEQLNESNHLIKITSIKEL